VGFQRRPVAQQANPGGRDPEDDSPPPHHARYAGYHDSKVGRRAGVPTDGGTGSLPPGWWTSPRVPRAIPAPTPTPHHAPDSSWTGPAPHRNKGGQSVPRRSLVPRTPDISSGWSHTRAWASRLGPGSHGGPWPPPPVSSVPQEGEAAILPPTRWGRKPPPPPLPDGQGM